MFTVIAWAKWFMSWLAWLGIGLVPFAVCAAVIWFIPPLRKWAALAAVGWGLAFGGYTLGDSNGAARVNEEWRAAERRAIERGDAARERAEREIAKEEQSAPPAPAVCDDAPRAPKLRDDIYDRDNH